MHVQRTVRIPDGRRRRHVVGRRRRAAGHREADDGRRVQIPRPGAGVGIRHPRPPERADGRQLAIFARSVHGATSGTEYGPAPARGKPIRPEAAGPVFHGVEKVSAIFPWSGKTLAVFSTVWKKERFRLFRGIFHWAFAGYRFSPPKWKKRSILSRCRLRKPRALATTN